MKFSIASLLFLVLLAATGCAAIVNANGLWRQAMVTLTAAALIIASVGTAVDRSRLFCRGFAMAGWIYFLLAFSPSFNVRDNLLTQQAVRWLSVTVLDADPLKGPGLRVAFSPQGDALSTAQGNSTQIWNASTGKQVWYSKFDLALSNPSFQNLADIGHALWTLIVAFLGGFVAVVVAHRGRRTANRQQPPTRVESS